MSLLDDLNARLAAYRAAELRILNSQEYQIGSGSTQRRNKLAELSEVRAAIADLEGQIGRHTAISSRARRVVYIRPMR